MKKSKVFLLGSTILLAMGSLTMTACGLEELFGTTSSGEKEEKTTSDNNDVDEDDEFYIDDSELEEGMVRGKDTSFTVSINGLQAYYSPTETIEWDTVTLTLTYDDLTIRTLTNVEYDVDERNSNETEFILYTDGLYAASVPGSSIKEDTYNLSYRIYLEEYSEDEYGLVTSELAMYRGVPVNQSTIVIASRPSQIYRVYSFEAPTLQIEYEKSLSESVSSEGGSENEDKFFVEPEYYEVGDDNPFTYKPRLIWMNRETGVLEYPDSFNVNFSVYRYIEPTDSWTKLDLDNNEYVSLSGFDFTFTDGGICVGEVFRITVTLSDFTTDMTNNPIPTYSFTVRVKDGWNVYDELDLGRMCLTSEEFDTGWNLYSWSAYSTLMNSAKEKNYLAHGRAFFADGTPGAYQIYANKYWVDENGEPVSESEVLENDDPEKEYHQEYSLTQDVDYEKRDGDTGAADNRFEYRVKLDDYWYNFLESKGRTDLHQVNGIFLHTNLTLTEDCIPPEFFLTNEEAYYLGPNSGSGLSSWGSTIAAVFEPLLGVSENGEDYMYDDMEGAVRDRANLYLHHLEDDFTLNGNLFYIDTKNLKWCMNNVFMSNMNFYYTVDTAFVVQSNACLFEFDYNREATHPDHNNDTDGAYAAPMPVATVTNLRYKGNSRSITEAGDYGQRAGRAITNAEFASGSLSFIKSQSAQVKVDNVICTDANIAYWSQQVHENDELYGIEVTNSKTYDCYTTAFYIWCGGNVKTSDSEYKRFGGSMSICISTYEGSNGIVTRSPYYLHDFSDVVYQTDSNGNITEFIDTSSTSVAWPSTLIIGDNVTVESYVGGSESWFVLNNASSVVTLVKGYDYLLNRAGKTMIACEDPEDDNYGKFNLKGLFMDTTYILSGSYKVHGSYISDQDNVWENGYEINPGAGTKMQHYIDEYAGWESVKVGEHTEKQGTLVKKDVTVEDFEDVATPIFFTNSGKAFGFTCGEDVVSMADPVGDKTVLYDLEEYERTGNKVAGKFDNSDTEVYVVIPLQVDLDGIEVNFSEILLDLLGLGSWSSNGTVMSLVDAVCEWIGIDDPEHCNLGDLMRIDIDLYEIDGLSSILSLLKLFGIELSTTQITVGMGDTLIGVVMDLYDYNGTAS